MSGPAGTFFPQWNHTGVMDEQKLHDEANHLYLTDVEFRALVDTAVGVVNTRCIAIDKRRMNATEHLRATQAAALALVLSRET